MGRLIVIEGLDGCGKSTQLRLLAARLQDEGVKVKTVSFPDYDAPSCAPVKMYLAGAFGTRPGDVNPYAASSFYAVDRFSSYKRNWEEFYKDGGVVVCGRYVTSNAVHQCSKLPEGEMHAFMDWLADYEYDRIGIPRPDLVVYLDMPNEFSSALMESRYGGDESKKDIHEKDEKYRAACRKSAEFAAKKWGWVKVNCVKDQKVRDRGDIAEEIYGLVSKFLMGENYR